MSHRLPSTVCCVIVALLTWNVVAQPRPEGSSESGHSASRVNSSSPDPGSITNGVYRNPFFGFTYKLPFGWVDRTEDMRTDAELPTQSTDEIPKPSASRAKPLVLLAVFERPPEATGSTINSAVVIAAEPVSSYPGLMNAENYFGPLTELARSRSLNVVNQPYEYHAGAKILMRGDFNKELGKLTMYQSSLVMMEKRYVVSFTFIGGSEDEVDELLQRLNFSASGKPATPDSKPSKH
jgi:hypothetical protein